MTNVVSTVCFTSVLLCGIHSSSRRLKTGFSIFPMRKLRHKRLHHVVTQQSHKGPSALGSSRCTASFAKPLFSVLMSGVTDGQTVEMRDSKRIQPWWRRKFTALPLPWDNVLTRALQIIYPIFSGENRRRWSLGCVCGEAWWWMSRSGFPFLASSGATGIPLPVYLDFPSGHAESSRGLFVLSPASAWCL